MNNQQKPDSSLVQNISRFAYAVSGVAAFYLAPPIVRYLRPDMFRYLATEFSYDLATWGSWGFVIVVIIASFFGFSALLQLLVQALIRSFSRKGVF